MSNTAANKEVIADFTSGHIQEIDGWKFEIVQIRARRVKQFGEPYDGIASITIVDGVPHVEGLLCKPPEFSRRDYKAFTKLLSGMWNLVFKYQRIKNAVKKPKVIAAESN